MRVTTTMNTAWHIHVPRENAVFLNKKLLGLTFFERRLREARQLQIPRVIVTKAPEIELPKVDPKFCASYEIQRECTEPASPISIYSVNSLEKNPRVVFEIKSQDDFRSAKIFYKRQIIDGSSAGWVAKKINKRFSLPVSGILSNTFLTPNMWTFFNMFIGLSSAFFVASPGYWNGFIGGFLLQLASIFDGVDGEIAKFRHESSKWGAVLDSIADNGTLIAFLIGLISYSMQESQTSNVSIFLAGAPIALAFILIAVVWNFSRRYLDSHSLVSFDHKFLKYLPSTDPLVRIAKSLKDYVKKDFYSVVFFIFCALGKRELILYFVGSVALFSLIVVFGVISKHAPSKPSKMGAVE